MAALAQAREPAVTVLIRCHVPRVTSRKLSRVLRAYYFGPDHPAKMRLWALLRRAMGHSRLTVPYASTGWISLDERDFLQAQVFASGQYEQEVWLALAEHAWGAETVWDVGGHIGTFAVRALQHPLVKEVHCFEPDPLTLEVLAANLSLNAGGHATYRVHPVALGSGAGEQQLFRGPLANTGLTTLGTDLGYGSTTVRCMTADDIIARGEAPAPTLIKIDVEGWELPVLTGAERLLKDSPPRAIALEAAVDATGEVADPRLPAFLHEHGYAMHRIDRPSGAIDVRENFIAVHGQRSHGGLACARQAKAGA